MRIFGSLLFLAIGCGSLLAACSSTSNSAAGGCASNPFACPAGQTCTVKDASGAFACLPSGSGKNGDACQNTAGVATCGDTLVCLQVVQSGGNCTHYCDIGSSTHGCAVGEQCRAAALQGTSNVFYVCVGTTPPADAGTPDAAKPDASPATDAAAEVDAATD